MERAIAAGLLLTGALLQDRLPLDRMAEHVVHSLEPVPDERIALRLDPETLPAFEPVVRRALERAGARVETWSGGPIRGFAERLESTDVYIWLPGASRVTSAEESEALRRWVDRGGVRRELHFHWSEGTRSPDGTSAAHTADFDRMYAAALDIDYAALKTRQDRAIALLQSGEVHVTTPAGTDLRFRVDDRPFNRQDGDAARRRVARARIRIDRHIELPAGVIRVAPLELSVNGLMVMPARGGGSVRLRFVKGKAPHAGSEVDFREFALGFNRELAVRPGSGLIPYYGYGDGVVRLSLGDNEELGGNVRGGPVLWSFFSDATVRAGDRVLVNAGRTER